MANSGDGVLQRVCLLRGVMGFERSDSTARWVAFALVRRMCARRTENWNERLV